MRSPGLDVLKEPMRYRFAHADDAGLDLLS